MFSDLGQLNDYSFNFVDKSDNSVNTIKVVNDIIMSLIAGF